MLHDHPTRRGRMRRGRYRPAHAWLGSPGDGPVIRTRRGGRRWRFRQAQVRTLLLALLLGAIAWSQLAQTPEPIAATRAAR